MIRRVVLLTAIALFLPVAALANSTLVFSNTGGNITFQNNKYLAGSSTLTSFTGLNGSTVSGSLGVVNYKTGAFVSGSVATSATFAPGGFFQIKGNGTNGLPNGVIFTGAFTSQVDWLGSFNPSGNNNKGAWTYVLSGQVAGTIHGIGSGSAAGATVQFTFDVPNGKQFSKTVRLKNGITTTTVPEPGTLGLLGSGLIGLAGLIRRRFASQV